MLRLLKFLFTGDFHVHHWVIIDTSKVTRNDNSESWVRYYLQCTECGEVKHYDAK